QLLHPRIVGHGCLRGMANKNTVLRRTGGWGEHQAGDVSSGPRSPGRAVQSRRLCSTRRFTVRTETPNTRPASAWVLPWIFIRSIASRPASGRPAIASRTLRPRPPRPPRVAPVQKRGAEGVRPADGPVQQGPDDRLGGRLPGQGVQVPLHDGGAVL